MSEKIERERTPGFTIDVMQPEDVEEATEMRLQSWLDTYVNDEAGVTKEWIEERNKVQRSAQLHEARKGRLAMPDTAAWIARSDDSSIIGVTTPYTDKKGVQHVGSLYVNKEFHGAGVGSALMQKVVDYFDDTKPIEIGVVTYNRRAQAFYKKWDFEFVPNSETLFDNLIPEVRMIRQPTQPLA